MADLTDTQVHGLLAMAAALGKSAGLSGADMMGWRKVAAIGL